MSATFNRRAALSALAVTAVGLPVVAACGGGGDSPKDSGPVAKVTYTPALDGGTPSPGAEFSVKVESGTIRPDITLKNEAGKIVKGTRSDDGTTYTIAEQLGYGKKYTWTGVAVGTDDKEVPIAGSFTCVQPTSTISVKINLADGQEVGIAAPLILQFSDVIEDKAAAEKALKLTTTPETEGAWAWLPEDNGSRAHWRPKNYFKPGTKVSMTGKLYGVKYGDGVYGDSDVTSEFVIARHQLVKADASSHRMVVLRGSETILDLPCSYGEGDLDRNVTRSGIHVVQEKHEQFYMSNPAAGYFNVLERWSVRISNNGEFIHANPDTTGVQGAANVTNGCINLSTSDAEQYFHTALFGDPVEVTNTRIDLSEADGDIYDWTIPWETWLTMSALTGKGNNGSKAPATPSGAPTSVKPSS